jgi:hypothetical protein
MWLDSGLARLWTVIGGVGLVCLVAGCGSGEPSRFPAKGKVQTSTGQPCGGALVVFHPQEEDRKSAVKPFATTKEDGSFELMTMQPGDGAAAGGYAVTIVWNDSGKGSKLSLSGEGGGGGQDRLGGRFGDPQNPKFKVEVVDGQPNIFDFQVN